MNILQALRYPFSDRAWPRKLGVIALLSPVPIAGQMLALGYALITLGRLQSRDNDGMLPEARPGWDLCWLGLQATLLTVICGVVVAFLGAPLLFAESRDFDPLTPAMVQALRGPSMLLVAVVSAVVSAVVVARFALTGRFGGALNPIEAWTLLRAEPAIWITAALVGYVAIEGPYALAWVLPLSGPWDAGATVLACSVFWTFGQMFNAYVISDALDWSLRSAATRAAEVRYRW